MFFWSLSVAGSGLSTLGVGVTDFSAFPSRSRLAGSNFVEGASNLAVPAAAGAAVSPLKKASRLPIWRETRGPQV